MPIQNEGFEFAGYVKGLQAVAEQNGIPKGHVFKAIEAYELSKMRSTIESGTIDMLNKIDSLINEMRATSSNLSSAIYGISVSAPDVNIPDYSQELHNISSDLSRMSYQSPVPITPSVG